MASFKRMDKMTDWRRYWVSMAEPGYIAVHCYRDDVWDQFPLFEGKVDLKYIQDWADDHEHRYHDLSSLKV